VVARIRTRRAARGAVRAARVGGSLQMTFGRKEMMSSNARL
jgi:hypothetical protein